MTLTLILLVVHGFFAGGPAFLAISRWWTNTRFDGLVVLLLLVAALNLTLAAVSIVKLAAAA